jgi:hypothetical protein
LIVIGLPLRSKGLAGGHPHPAFADAVLVDIGLLDALEADADAALEQFGIVEGAVGLVARRSGGVSLIGSAFEFFVGASP